MIYNMLYVANAVESGRGLHQTMDAVSQLRTDHTATTLSLIATIFLPLTFIAGEGCFSYMHGDNVYIYILIYIIRSIWYEFSSEWWIHYVYVKCGMGCTILLFAMYFYICRIYYIFYETRLG